MPTFFEFFAGGGMARAGLGEGWECLFANDFDKMKADTYRKNWGDDITVGDINNLTAVDLPGSPDMAWASFPCQDLSLAGNYEGIGHWADAKKTRSGTFWPFWALMRSLAEGGRSPRIVVLENVYGALTSNSGKDFAAIASCFSGSGFRFGGIVVDARLFLPHSRPRLFVVGVRGDLEIPDSIRSDGTSGLWHPAALVSAFQGISTEAKKKWVWWNLPEPPKHGARFADLIEENPDGVDWHSKSDTLNLLSMMSPLHKSRVEDAKKAGVRVVGTIYRRTRSEGGVKVQRAEVRFDDVAGCLRTPSGGSSRQSILVIDGNRIRSRLLSPREVARLMGLPDTYKLPDRYNDAYHLAGDGVAVPVVRHIAKNLLEPILAENRLMLAAE
jgi:DNA (cytosine-5)-methyltransferase 1